MSLSQAEDIEEKINDHQEGLIAAEYGAVEMGRANYGWGVEETDEYISVATKVYGPAMKLVTNVYFNQPDDFEDVWSSL